MKRSAIIVLDTGTTSMRGILFGRGGGNLGMRQVDNAPEYCSDGRVEQDASTWGRALALILSALADTAKAKDVKVEAIALTSQRSSVLPVDKEGIPLHRTIMWQDTRTEGICASLAGLNGLVYSRTGLRISPVFSAAKMRWFRDFLPSIYAGTHKMLGIQDYLLHLLTGRFCTDRSLASRTNLFNLDTLDWDQELVDAFGVERRLLCDLIDPGARAGGLRDSVASASGLAGGIPVFSCGGDQQCAALGMGLLDGAEAVVNTGTGSYVLGCSPIPVRDPAMGISCNVAAVPGTYIVEAAILAGGAAYRWFRDRFYGKAEGEDSFGEINAEVQASPPGSRGVLLMPNFRGAGAPRWNPMAKGYFYGLGLATSRGDMARSILEGIAFSMKEGFDLMEAVSGKKSRLIAAGGLAKFDEFVRILADVFGLPVELAVESESTALGAWIRASRSLGWHGSEAEAFSAALGSAPRRSFEPDPERMPAYRLAMERRARLDKAVSLVEDRS